MNLRSSQRFEGWSRVVFKRFWPGDKVTGWASHCCPSISPVLTHRLVCGYATSRLDLVVIASIFHIFKAKKKLYFSVWKFVLNKSKKFIKKKDLDHFIIITKNVKIFFFFLNLFQYTFYAIFDIYFFSLKSKLIQNFDAFHWLI